MNNPKFQIDRCSDGNYCFYLLAPNGQVILKSEKYPEKSICKNGIISVRAFATEDEMYEKQISGNGKHCFVLKTFKGDIIGWSQVYSSVIEMENVIFSVKTSAQGSPVEDLTIVNGNGTYK